MADGSRRYRDDEDDDDRPARRRKSNEYEGDAGFGSSAPMPAKKGMNVVGLIAMILGILGLPLAAFPCTFFVGLPIAAIGLLLGVIGLFTSGKTTGRGFPIAGTSLSLVGVLAGTAWLLFTFVWVKKTGNEIQQAQVRWEEQVRQAEEQRKKDAMEMKEVKAITVTAKKLAEEYDQNPINADNKYKGKILEVSGVVEKVDRDRLGKAWIELEIPGETVLKCEFPKDGQAALAAVEAKKAITVRGRCKGKIKTIQSEEDIVLENCAIVKK